MNRSQRSRLSVANYAACTPLMLGWAAIMGSVPPATAQEAASAAPTSVATATPADDAQSVGLQEIVVTAQKRSQNVQDTPLSVTAVSGASLATKSIVNVVDLARIDPALQIGHSTGVVTTFIRGIGNPVTTAGNEASVPVYIDDVYFVRASYPFFSLGSVDRVEVLKGPQGTLFGRNASGGVISIYTRDPDFTSPEMSGKVGGANYDTIYGQLYVNRPITDTLAVNFSVDANKQHGGWGINTATGTPTFREHHVSMRGKILWEPTESTKIKLIGYYERAYNEQGIYGRPFPGTVGGYPDGLHNGFPPAPGFPIGVLPKIGFYDESTAFNQYDRSSGYGGSVRLDQGLGDIADFVSITAIRRNKELYASSGDYDPSDQLRYDLHVLDHQFSQEFQLKSKGSSKLTWILGGYYLNALQGFDPTIIHGIGTQLTGVDNVAIVGKERIKSLAAFAQATYPITRNTNITGGLRYTIDKVSGQGTTTLNFLPGVFAPGPFSFVDQRFDANNACSGLLANAFFGAPTAGTCGAPNPDASKTFRKITYKASVDHHFGDNVMAYANYSRGYKAGTFNTLPLDSPALKPEVVDAYEVGMKTELFDRRVRLNAALFWNDIKSPQVQSQRNGLVALINAGSARTRGVEFDASALLAPGLTASLAGTYLDAKFRDFKSAPSYCPSPVISNVQCAAILAANGTSPAVIATIGDGNLNQIFVSADGNRLPYSSKLKISGGLNYTFEPDGVGKIILDGSVNYQSNFNWDSDNVIKEPAHTFFDASIQLTPASLENISFRLWGKNLSGVHYNVAYYAQASGSAFSSAPGAPRTFGGEVLFKF
ncbi:MAG: TonB-dependent receptor [Sphingomonadales bacterium]|nr:TonB-dependent receptor [Sphingomonadales bacterium]